MKFLFIKYVWNLLKLITMSNNYYYFKVLFLYHLRFESFLYFLSPDLKFCLEMCFALFNEVDLSLRTE